MMNSNQASPNGSWPYNPRWELDGFLFNDLPHFDNNSRVKVALYMGDFTSGTSNTPFQSLSRKECSERVRNNIAAQFQAMMFCEGKHLLKRPKPPKPWWTLRP